MRTVQCGISLAPNIADMNKLRELARLADTLGLDLLGLQDHPYVSRFFDTMSLISVQLAEIRRLRIFPKVASREAGQECRLAGYSEWRALRTSVGVEVFAVLLSYG